jgi:hypothetical protein
MMLADFASALRAAGVEPVRVGEIDDLEGRFAAMLPEGTVAYGHGGALSDAPMPCGPAEYGAARLEAAMTAADFAGCSPGAARWLRGDD